MSALFTWRVGERKHCLPGGLVNVSIVYLEVGEHKHCLPGGLLNISIVYLKGW